MPSKPCGWMHFVRRYRRILTQNVLHLELLLKGLVNAPQLQGIRRNHFNRLEVRNHFYKKLGIGIFDRL